MCWFVTVTPSLVTLARHCHYYHPWHITSKPARFPHPASTTFGLADSVEAEDKKE